MSLANHRIDLEVALDAIRRRFVWVLVPLLLVPVMAVASRAVFGAKLKASSLVLVEENVRMNPVLKEMMVEMEVRSRLPEIRSLVRSSKTVEPVLRKLGVVTDGMNEAQVAAQVEAFRNQVEVFGEGGGLVRITLVGRDADQVHEGLNLLTQSLINEMLEPRKRTLHDTVNFLESQLKRFETELAEVDKDLTSVSQEMANTMPEVRTLLFERHRELNAALLEAETTMVELAGGGKASTRTVTRYNRTQARLSADLSEARDRLRDLRATFTLEHPQVKAAQARVDRLQDELRAVGDGTEVVVTEPVRRAQTEDPAAVKRKVEYLKAQVQASLDELKGIAAAEGRVNQLTRIRNAKAEAHAKLLQRYEEAVVARDLAGNEGAEEIRVIEAPVRSQVAPSFGTRMLAIAGLFGGLMLGLLLVFVVEFFDPTVRSADEAEAAAGVPVLGRVFG